MALQKFTLVSCQLLNSTYWTKVYWILSDPNGLLADEKRYLYFNSLKPFNPGDEIEIELSECKIKRLDTGLMVLTTKGDDI